MKKQTREKLVKRFDEKLKEMLPQIKESQTIDITTVLGAGSAVDDDDVPFDFQIQLRITKDEDDMIEGAKGFVKL